MLVADNVPFVVPLIGTGIGSVDKQVIPVVVIGDDTSSGGEVVTTLVGEGTIPASVPI
jgi:hypothetical protein